jgi:FkbM family methyltransferase
MRSPRAYALSMRPYTTARFLLRRPHDPEYRVFGLFPQAGGLFLDVGANAGMSALSFRLVQRKAPILSVEPNPYHESNLRWAGRLAGRHDFRLWAAGEADGELDLYVPIYRGVPITAEASVIPGFVEQSTSLRDMLGERMDSAEFEVVKRTVPVRALDGLGAEPAFVKLDVQGFELPALKGLHRTLARCHPPTLIETPGPDIDAFMSELGYRPFVYDAATHTRRPRTADSHYTNVLYVAG